MFSSKVPDANHYAKNYFYIGTVNEELYDESFAFAWHDYSQMEPTLLCKDFAPVAIKRATLTSQNTFAAKNVDHTIYWTKSGLHTILIERKGI